MREHRFPQDEGGHLPVGLVVQEAVEAVLRGLFAASIRHLVDVQGQTRDGLRNHTHTRIYSRYLNSRLHTDRLAGPAWSKEKGRYGTDRVGRLISCFEKAEQIDKESPPESE